MGKLKINVALFNQNFDKAVLKTNNVIIISFVVYLTTLSESQIIWRRRTEKSTYDELERSERKHTLHN